MRKVFLTLALVCIAALSFVTTGCPKNEDGTPKVSDSQIRGGARVVRVAALEFLRELDSEVATGELGKESADLVRPYVASIDTISALVTDDPRNFDTLTPAERAQLITDYITELTAAASRLEAAGALHLKSDKARAQFAKVQRGIRRGISVARIVQAALPPAPTQ